jgi:hypothetical protein
MGGLAAAVSATSVISKPSDAGVLGTVEVA